MKTLTKHKILFIMQLPPPVHGVSVMSKIIYDSEHINEQFHCDYVNLSTSRTVNDLQRGKLYKLWLALGVFTKAFYKLQFRRYKYVYITIFPYGPSFIKDSLIVLLAKLFFQRPILHIHSYGFRKHAARSRLRRVMYRFVFSGTELICLSDLLIEDMETIYKGPVYILPNGVPQVNFKNDYNCSKEEPTLLYLSNLIRGKGIYLVLEAASILKGKGYKFKVRVAGPEGDVKYADLEREVERLGIRDVVSLLGPRFGEDKYTEYRNADLFLLPSDYDTFGLVLLDAMQFGVPGISSRIGGIPDVLGDGRGVLISDVDAQKLAREVEELINNPALRKEMSEKGFGYFKLNFTTDIFEQRLAAILSGNPGKVSRSPFNKT